LEWADEPTTSGWGIKAVLHNGESSHRLWLQFHHNYQVFFFFVEFSGQRNPKQRLKIT